MRHTFRRNVLIGLVSVAAIVVVARASGVPTNNSLIYRGELEEGGKPITGSRDIQLRLWNDATSTAAGNLQCNFIPPDPTAIDNGRFELVLPSECVQAVKDNADLWIEIIVNNTSLGRSPISAVPYAMEAGRPSYVNATTGRRSTTGGYCGSTAAVNGLITGGYAGAKTLCETQCQSATAHVCRPDEILQFVETGGSLPAGRYQTGLLDSDTSSTNDCNGWSTTSFKSAYWSIDSMGRGHPSNTECNGTDPLLCCN